MKTFKKVLISVMAIALLLCLAAIALAACNSSVVISFESNGGEDVEAIETSAGETVDLPILKSKKSGGSAVAFAGWSRSKDLGGDLLAGPFVAPKKSLTLYAKWAEDGIKLTLDAGGGALDVSSVYMYEGQNILTALDGIVPTSPSGLKFAAWYIGGSRVDEDDVMPQTATTAVARYGATYTVRYFLQMQSGEYEEREDLGITAIGVLGEVISAPEPDIDGYTINAMHIDFKDRVTITQNESDNVMNIYYDLVGKKIVYNANAPSGTVATGYMNSIPVPDGKKVTAAECGYSIIGYRFLGWADSPRSLVPTYKVGEEVNVTRQTFNLYAVWLRGKRDALGGEDYLFIYDDEPDVVYLQRNGIGEKKGEYSAATGEFLFKDESAATVLSGKVEGDYFYYFNLSLKGTFRALGGNEKLTIGDGYVATFKDASGAVKSGKIAYDVDWRYYVFIEDGKTEVTARFIFTESEGTTYIQLQNMDEAGYYATSKGYPVIYLDGLGNFRYFFDPLHPDYVDQVSGEALLEAFGVYSVNEDGYYFCQMYSGDNMDDPYNHREDFLFRFTDETPGAVRGYDLKDKAIERSTLYGQLNTELYLDGFGGGVYTTFADETDSVGTPHKGTYDVVHNWWMTEDSRSSMNAWLINFKYDGATQDIYYAITQDSYGNLTAQLFGKVTKGGVGGLSVFTNALTLGGESYDDAFIMYLLDAPNETMVLVKIDEGDLSSGEKVSIYAPMYTGTVTALPTEGVYHFDDVTGKNQMNFRLNEDGTVSYVTNTGDGSLETITIDKNLIVDPNTSTATYTDANGTKYENVRYSYSNSAILEFYTFDVTDDIKLYYYRDREAVSGEFVKVSAQNIMDYAYVTESLANAYPARLLLVEGSTTAYLAIPMDIGAASYVGYGEYAPVEGSDDEYTYQNRTWVEGLIEFFGGDGFKTSLDQFIAYYGNFTFRKEDASGDDTGKFYSRRDDMYFTCDNFKADGYSNEATYTLDGGTTVSGTFTCMESIVVFTYGRDEYYLKKDNESNRMKNVSDDAGLYYYYDIDNTFFEVFGPNSGTSYSDYIVYDGGDGVTLVHYENGTVPNRTDGKMTKTANWTEDFREYTVEDLNNHTTYTVLLGTFVSLWNEEFMVFDRYDDAYKGFDQNGDWWTEENGKLHGDGYRMHAATYDADGDGVVDYYGLMVRATFDDKDIQTHAYTTDPNGNVIVFTYSVTTEISNSIVFDIIDNEHGYLYLRERKLLFGAFAYWEAGARDNTYMYLDGNGGATLYDELGMPAGNGTYRLAPEIDDVSYYYEDSVNASQSFYFAIYIEQESTGFSYFEYRKYDSTVEGEYVSDVWEYLSMGFYGEITYIDRYGVVYEGYYRKDNEYTVTLVTYDGSGVTFTFHFLQSSGYFELAEQPNEPQGN